MLSKIKTQTEIVTIAKEARAMGKTIVFTNGCFDLIHIGHVSYLQDAKDLGDILIIGLNSDSSIKQLKGDKRPLVPQNDRAAVLAALECISYVVLFEEETPAKLIEAINPQILVKGGDYSDKPVAGADFVKAHGGRLELIPFVPGKSTSALIESIIQKFA